MAMLGDLQYALRSLRHHRMFALVSILSIALGIGANALIFSLADALLLRPLAVERHDRVVAVRWQEQGQTPGSLSNPDFEEIRGRAKSFEGMSAYQVRQFGYAKDRQALAAGRAGMVVSGNFFETLHVKAALGRTFARGEDEVAGRDAVVVLSHALWQDDFGGSAEVLGRHLLLNGIEFRVIGVAEEGFTGMDQFFRPSLYVPLAMAPRLEGASGRGWLEERDQRRLQVTARLRDGVAVEQAHAEVGVLGAALRQAHPKTNGRGGAVVRTETQLRSDRSPYDAIITWMLVGLAAVVLLIACANVANLMLGRALGRTGEVAIRMAIGAGRWRIVRQMLTESLLLTLIAAGVGLAAAQAGIDLIFPFRIPSEIPVELSGRLDGRVVGYALLAALLSAVVCGLMPALRATGQAVEPALRAGGRNMEPRRRFLGRDALVVVQVAGSLVLLIIATQLYRGISYVVEAPAGFRKDHLLMASFDPSLARYDTARTAQFYEDLLRKTGSLAGVKSAALAELVPMANRGSSRRVLPEGYRSRAGEAGVNLPSNVVSEGYFETAGIPLKQGRGFRPSDDAQAAKVVVVNERLAQMFYRGEALGKRMKLGEEWAEVVGVAANSKYNSLLEPPSSYVYLPRRQQPAVAMTLLAETAGASEELAGPVRAMVRAMDASQPVFALRTMEEYYHERATLTNYLLLGLLGGMGLLGLALALAGLYAVMAWSVARRSREIAIRMSVGANGAAMLRMVLAHGLKLSGVGVLIGLGLSLGLSRALTEGMRVPSFDNVLIAGVTLALVGMSVVGALAPAVRAARMDPVQVLKQD